MNKYTLLFLCLLPIYTISYSQLSEGGLPLSFGIGSQNDLRSLNQSVHSIRFTDPDIDSLKLSIAKDTTCSQCRVKPYGVVKNAQVNVVDPVRKQMLKSGFNIWVLNFQSNNALGYQFHFSDFRITGEGKLYIYNSDRTEVLGAYTKNNNLDGGLFSTQIIYGNNVYIEYFQPQSDTSISILNLKNATYVFENVMTRAGAFTDGHGPAAECNHNVVCPAGLGWEKEVKSVVIILITDSNNPPTGLSWVCTGVLLNNSKNDGAPYLLTAEHCSRTPYSTPKDYESWVFGFDYQDPTCLGDGTNAPTNRTVSGARLLAKGDKCTTSDYLLLELNESPLKYNPCFAGWSSYEYDGSSSLALGIHHPKGDVKKISKTINIPLEGKSWGCLPDPSTNNYWVVNWGLGITESGSSGSPLFNVNSKRVVGQLLGGGSYCNVNGPDYYGKFSKSFQSGNFSQWLGLGATDTYCPPVYNSTCFNRVFDAGEQAIDCGGVCPPCRPSCYDGIRNGNEVNIDCGGSCPPCPPTCFDYIQNQGEVGVDCGGPCRPCPIPSCDDHKKNQDETGIDCGGSICQPCVNFCQDGFHNGDELETDCGGSCLPCLSLIDLTPTRNGSFEYLNCIPWEFDSRISWGFTTTDKCVDGPWYSSHGHPGIRNWIEEDGSHSLRFFSTHVYNGLVQSDGLFYQFSENLDPYKNYTLYFKYREHGSPINVWEFFTTKGLQQSAKPIDNVPADWMPPTYPFSKYRISIWEIPNNAPLQTTWYDAKIDFSVPNDQFNQLWIYPHKSPYVPLDARLYIDDIILTVNPGAGPTCANMINYTNNSNLPLLTEAKKGIVTNGSVVVNQNQLVQFKSEGYVLMNPGFSSTTGSKFKAEIERCGITTNFRTFKTKDDSIDYVTNYAPRVHYPITNNTHNSGFKSVGEGEYLAEQSLSCEIYPNPTLGEININILSSFVSSTIVSVQSIYGEKVTECVMENSFKTIDISNLDSGIYIITVTNGDNCVHKKIILQ